MQQPLQLPVVGFARNLRMRAIVRGGSLGTGAILVADQLFDDQASRCCTPSR